jgi:hypothetical protein
MRVRFFGSVAGLLGGAGLALAQAPGQAPASLPPAPPPALAPDSVKPALAAPPCPDNPCDRFWAGADYLMWWTKGNPTPPLLATPPGPRIAGPVIQTVPNPTSPGFIGLQTTIIGPTSVNSGNVGGSPLLQGVGGGDLRSGGRFVGGMWLDSERTIGLEGTYFFLTSRTTTLGAAADGTHEGSFALGIPFINAVNGQPAAYSVGGPTTTTITSTSINTTPDVFVGLFNTAVTSAASGQVRFAASSRLQGAEANAVWKPDILGKRLQLLAGFRYAQLDEGLGIASTVNQSQLSATTFEAALGLPTGLIQVLNNTTTVTTRVDQFDAHNNFYGAQVGAKGEYCWGRLSIRADGKVALGTMDESVNILGGSQVAGLSTVTPTQQVALAGIPLTVASGAPDVVTPIVGRLPGGLFAQPSNIGHYSRNAFAVVPEADFKVGYEINSHVRATVGYTFFYMSSVVRPGDQIDRLINPSFLALPPTGGAPARPTFQFKSTDYWAQGVDFGVEFRF